MTNKEAKEKAIREAWGEETFLKINSFMDTVKTTEPWAYYHWKKSGWLKKGLLPIKLRYIESMESLNWFDHCLIPSDILFLDTNNGWTRIEPDGSNLPEINNSDTYYKVCFKEDDGSFKINDRHQYNAFQLDEMFRDGEYFTHYKPIEVEKLPIW